jgi:soluble lytic murein transglycosylase
MITKKRAVFTLAAEFAVLLLGLIIVMLAFGADQTISEFDKREYPKKYSYAVEIAAAEFDLPENLIYAVIKAESGFDQKAVSSAGALGLMQVMPSTYESDIKPKLGFEKSGKAALFNYMINVRSGAYYLSYLYKYCGNLETALAMYNAGIGNVQSWLKNKEYSRDGKTLIHDKIPVNETRVYVSRVMYYYERYNSIYGEKKEKIIEDPIFEKYGVRITWLTKKGENGSVYVNELACYAWARHYAELYPDADPMLIMAIIKTESDFRLNAVSRTGASGLMQILETTYDEIKIGMKTDEPYSALLRDGQFAVKCGMYYVQWLHTPSLKIGTDTINIAAAYNGGCGNVRNWLKDGSLASGGVLIPEKIPRAETRNYVKKIMSHYEYYRDYLGAIFTK